MQLLSTPGSAYSPSVPVSYPWIGSLMALLIGWTCDLAKQERITRQMQSNMLGTGRMELMQSKWFLRSGIKNPFVMSFSRSKQISVLDLYVYVLDGWIVLWQLDLFVWWAKWLLLCSHTDPWWKSLFTDIWCDPPDYVIVMVNLIRC